MNMISRFENIVAAFKNSFEELTAMERFTFFSEDFSVFYSSDNPFDDEDISTEKRTVTFKPVFVRGLEGNTDLFAEIHVAFIEHDNGTITVNLSGDFGTANEAVMYYERAGGFEESFGGLPYQTEFFEKDAADEDFVNYFKRVVTEFAQEHPVYFIAKTADELVEATKTKQGVPISNYPDGYDEVPF